MAAAASGFDLDDVVDDRSQADGIRGSTPHSASHNRQHQARLQIVAVAGGLEA
jgi:hypothetical protein